MRYMGRYASPLGGMLMAGDGEALTGLWFEGAKYFAAGLAADCEERPLPVFETTARWLDAYFAGQEPDAWPRIALSGSPFRQAVWRILREIPCGQTTTYGEIARRLERESGKRVSAQAVGGAVGHNPVSILVPCHRVVASGGALTGYAGGIEKKAALLALEAQRTSAQKSDI